MNKLGSVRTLHSVAFALPLLPWKNLSITYSECVCVCVAFVIQYEKSMRRIILSSVACPAVPYFPAVSHKRHDFQKKLLNI